MGLLARYAAVALLALTVVIQSSYVALDSQLFSLALLGRYALAGAGPVSIDHLPRRGLARSPFPLVPRIARATAVVERTVAPVYLSLVRAWLGATLWLVAADFQPGQQPLATWLPWKTVALVPDALALAARALLRWRPDLVREPVFSAEGLPRIVIVGAGFGGLACASALRAPPSPLSIAPTTTCSSRSCTRWPPPRCRPAKSRCRSGPCSATRRTRACCWGR